MSDRYPRLTSKGQITIPKEIRDHMGIRPGDEVVFVKKDYGRVTLVGKGGDILEMRGMLKNVVPKRRRPLTVREMDEAILREHSKERAKKR